MKFTILTIFPNLIDLYLNFSILKKAKDSGLLEVEVLNIRTDKHKQVDDYAYGGRSGMVLKIEPIVEALRTNNLLDKHIVLLTPSGQTLNQDLSKHLSENYDHIVLICGHYEGVDARISEYIDSEISIGDYIITSGELSALVLLDSVVRLIPGVINADSLITESFNNYLLDYPVYTRPQIFEGLEVPPIYLSGNHESIDSFRLEEQKRITKSKRPDLFKKYLLKNT